MVKKSTIFHTVKALIVKQNVLRAFTGVCCAAITAMTSVLLYFAAYWGEQMQHHTEQLNIVITQNSTILEHQKDQDARITDNRTDIRSLRDDTIDFKVRLARLEGPRL